MFLYLAVGASLRLTEQRQFSQVCWQKVASLPQPCLSSSSLPRMSNRGQRWTYWEMVPRRWYAGDKCMGFIEFYQLSQIHFELHLPLPQKMAAMTLFGIPPS